MQGKDSATVPEQNERGNEYMLKNQMDTCIFAVRFSSFYKSFKKDSVKISIHHHLLIQIKSLCLSEKRFQKAWPFLALYSFSCSCFCSLHAQPKLAITLIPHCAGGMSSAPYYSMTPTHTNQKDTSLRTGATEFHRHLLLLRNNHQEYCEDGTH